MAIKTDILARENRVMINNITKSIKSIELSVLNLSNHYSKRLPMWATVTITLLSSLVVGLIVAAVK